LRNCVPERNAPRRREGAKEDAKKIQKGRNDAGFFVFFFFQSSFIDIWPRKDAKNTNNSRPGFDKNSIGRVNQCRRPDFLPLCLLRFFAAMFDLLRLKTVLCAIGSSRRIFENQMLSAPDAKCTGRRPVSR